ncbi:pilus (MSHA type) biogenesis protein MshL [Candidatus Desulfobacillus denitrificans]|uniref:Pilus (MSHA type) biogenesis protein MshL n=1 Tax=Candidatus Desulfobacillus denitrificans TaxID=2608985 RepID=A0A809QZG4_9PROT|nr:pilus (MSHA type) biogenesis protein MshL [Candidatus Desulfobacillus denitrificans]
MGEIILWLAMTSRTTIVPLLAATLLGACSAPQTKPPSSGHIGADSVPAAKSNIPQPVQQTVAMPKPKPAAKTETYSVVVKDVKVEELLFALARDAKLNVDIHPGIRGTVTLNAIDQTLPQLLNRIAKQVDMRFELDGPNLVVMPDTPYLRTYKVDYVNMSRDTTGNVAINTQIASISPTAAGAAGAGAAAGGTSGNVSSTKVDNVAKNRFWETLEQNIKDILRETDKEIIVKRRVAEGQEQAAAAGAAAQSGAAGAGAGGPGAPTQIQVQVAPPQQQSTAAKEYETLQAASVMVNRETGFLMARATSRQHEKIQEFLDKVLTSARRQVLIEATIVEVRLSENYQQGIDWQYFNQGAAGRAIGQGSTTRSFSVNPLTGAFEATTSTSTLPSAVGNTLFSLAFRRGDFLTAIKLLENFGTLRVLSSPKISVLNNQTAILKVVDNIVYFQFKVDTTQGQTTTVTNVTTTPQSVAVGLVMSVTPQISENNSVLLNVRPTISRSIGEGKADPNPLIPAGKSNIVPEIQTREMESVMSVNNGDIAVLGGLMQDSVDNNDDAVPGVSKIPILGNIFTHRKDRSSKTELVIFLRPTVIKDASIQGDYSSFRNNLPRDDFFENKGGLQPVPEWNVGGNPQ